MDKALQGEEVTYNVEVNFPNFDYIKTLKMHYIPYTDKSGKVTGFISHGEDITEQQSIREQLLFNEFDSI